MSTIINQENNDELTPPSAYFGSLTIENVKCFKGKHEINLSYDNKPAMWTVILGDNNSGKTTLLRCLAGLEPEKQDFHLPLQNCAPRLMFKPIRAIVADDKIESNTSIYSEIMFQQYGKVDWGAYSENFEGKIKWSFSVDIKLLQFSNLIKKNLIIYSYGTSRRIASNELLIETEKQDNAETLFNNNATLCNIEKWLTDTDYASKNGVESLKLTIEKIRNVFRNGLLPNITEFKCTSTLINGHIDNFVEVEIDSTWIKLRDLGYGYQVTLAWIVDLVKKLFERYPNSENPLHEPAIVLIDEIDLHLHPEWQRKIISFLSQQFPKTQFIATTHSPLIVQSAENINLVLLEKQDNHVIIKQPDLKNYRGWTVDEILSELMGLDGKTKSETYLSLIKFFNKAVIKNDYISAKKTYDELDKLLHPNNIHRELLALQLNALAQETDD